MKWRAADWKDHFLLFGLALVALVVTAAVAQEPTPLYFGYSERSTGVIEVRFLSSTSLKTVQFTLHGDGRVLGKVVSSGADQAVLEEFDHRLSEEETNELVDEAVHSGLIDFETSRFVQDLRARGEAVPHVVDGNAIFFEIRLDFLARGAEAPVTPFSHSFVLDFPDEYVRKYPESREFRALQRIKQKLEEIYWSRGRQQ